MSHKTSRQHLSIPFTVHRLLHAIDKRADDQHKYHLHSQTNKHYPNTKIKYLRID